MSYKGLSVKHKLYGEGIVVKENPEFIFVNFKSGKKTQFANNESISKYLEFDLSNAVAAKTERHQQNKKTVTNNIEIVLSSETGSEFLDEWIKNKYDEALKYEKKCFTLIESFIKDFPMERIPELSLKEYMYAPDGCGLDEAFCKRIKSELRYISSMGNAFPSTFGIYLKGGEQITLAPTYANLFGDDYKKAFEYIKREIYVLLQQGYNGDIQGIANNNSLNNMFKYKLLSIYYPDKYFPVCARETAYEYAARLGVPANIDNEIIYNTMAAMKWRDKNLQTQNWSNSVLMSFCDWLWREKKAIGKNCNA